MSVDVLGFMKRYVVVAILANSLLFWIGNKATLVIGCSLDDNVRVDLEQLLLTLHNCKYKHFLPNYKLLHSDQHFYFYLINIPICHANLLQNTSLVEMVEVLN